LFCSIVLAPLFLFATPHKYLGEFQSIVSSGSPCDSLFDEGKYQVQHFITGPTHLTSVVYFQSENNKGFFNKVNLLGNNDGWGEMRVTREIIKDGFTFRVLADGLYDYGFLLLDLTVTAFKDLKQPALCKTTSQFSAFDN